MLNTYKIEVSYQRPDKPGRSYKKYEVYAANSQEALYMVRLWITEDLASLAGLKLHIRCENIWIERDGAFQHMLEDDNEN